MDWIEIGVTIFVFSLLIVIVTCYETTDTGLVRKRPKKYKDKKK